MNPYVLLLLGLVLIFLEFYLPGAVLGILGGILVTLSVFTFASQSDSILAITLYVIGVAIIIGLLIKFAIWRIKHAKPEFSIYSDDAQNGFVASHFDATAIGKEGVAASDLKPSGKVLVDGVQHQAVSQGSYITKGTEIIVVGGQEATLIVKPSKKGTSL